MATLKQYERALAAAASRALKRLALEYLTRLFNSKFLSGTIPLVTDNAGHWAERQVHNLIRRLHDQGPLPKWKRKV